MSTHRFLTLRPWLQRGVCALALMALAPAQAQTDDDVFTAIKRDNRQSMMSALVSTVSTAPSARVLCDCAMPSRMVLPPPNLTSSP